MTVTPPFLPAVSKLDDGDLDLAILGSTPWATLVSRGIDADTVMIEYVYKDNEVRFRVRNTDRPVRVLTV